MIALNVNIRLMVYQYIVVQPRQEWNWGFSFTDVNGANKCNGPRITKTFRIYTCRFLIRKKWSPGCNDIND